MSTIFTVHMPYVCAVFRAGADLQENSSVDNAVFNKEEGLWTITLEDGKNTYKARVMFCVYHRLNDAFLSPRPGDIIPPLTSSTLNSLMFMGISVRILEIKPCYLWLAEPLLVF